jgi:hypothetical protein
MSRESFHHGVKVPLSGPGSGGREGHLWGLFAAADGGSVDVGVGGWGEPRPAQVTAGD